jgi:hypothetical protein
VHDAVSVVSLTSSSGGYINGRNSANLELLIDKTSSIYLYVQVVGIPMGTNCAPLLADLFLFSHMSAFLQKLVKDKKIHEARAFNQDIGSWDISSLTEASLMFKSSAMTVDNMDNLHRLKYHRLHHQEKLLFRAMLLGVLQTIPMPLPDNI